MMKIKSKKMFFAFCMAVIICIASIIVYATTKNNYDDKKNETEVTNNELTREEITRLYNQGYSLQDISKAKSLSFKTQKSIDEILCLKGKKEIKTQKSKNSDTHKYPEGKKYFEKREIESFEIISEREKPWSEVEKELGLEPTISYIKLGISKEKFEDLKSKGVNENDIAAMAKVSKDCSIDIVDIYNQCKLGKSIYEVKKQYQKGK